MLTSGYINNGKTLSVVVSGESVTFHKEESEELFQAVLELCKAESFEGIKELQTLYNLNDNLAKMY